MSVSDFLRFHTNKNRHQHFDDYQPVLGHIESCRRIKWRLGSDEWQAWLSAQIKQVTASQSLSVSQAAEILNITNDVAYTLIRYGLLNSTVELRNGVTSQRINLDAIENFKQSYILGKELAKTLCLTSKETARHMKKLGVVPVAGPSSTPLKCRQYIWLRGPCFEMIKRGA